MKAAKKTDIPHSMNFELRFSNGDKFLVENKVLIGNSSSVDIFLDHEIEGPFVLLVRSGDNYDLVKVNNAISVFVEGLPVAGIEKAIVGKTIRIHESQFTIKEFEKTSTSLKVVSANSLDVVSQKNLDQYELIDGEYCNLILDDSSHKALHRHPFEIRKALDFVETSEALKVEVEKKRTRTCIEVVYISRGKILSTDYFEPRKGIYQIEWGVSEKQDLLLFKEGEMDVLKPNGFDMEVFETGSSKNQESLLGGKIYSFYKAPLQIFVREVGLDKAPKPSSFFQLDREFLITSLVFFFGLFLPALSLLFVDVTVPDKQRDDIAVVYRVEKPPVVEKIKPKIKIDQKVEKVEEKAMAIDKPETTTKTQLSEKIAPSRTEPKPEKNENISLSHKLKENTIHEPKVKINTNQVTQTNNGELNQVERKAPVKSYQLKLNNSVSALFGSQASQSNIKIKNTGRIAAFAGSSGSNSGKLIALDSSASSAVNVGTIGGDMKGNLQGAYGVQGLSNKKGINTSLSRKRTVVMGSMDPELIRRLLGEHLSQFRYCYQQEMQRSGREASSSTDLMFTIMPGGGVGNIKISQKGFSFSNSGVGCVKNVLGLIDFPKPKGGGRVDIRQPLNFSFSKSSL